MASIELQATIRTESGKGVARRLRAKALIPAVLYGKGEKPLNIALDPEKLKEALKTPKRLNTILTLKLDNGTTRTVLVKDYQTEIVHHDLLHADFLDVRMTEKVLVKIPLVYTGLAVGVTEGGILQVLRRELEVNCLPDDIPEKIEVDVASLKIGGSIHVKDVKCPKGVTPKFMTNFAIVGVVAPEKEEVAAPTAEEAAAAAAVPGAPAAPGAPGAPAAAGAAPGAPAAKGAAPAAAPAAAAPAKGGKK